MAIKPTLAFVLLASASMVECTPLGPAPGASATGDCISLSEISKRTATWVDYVPYSHSVDCGVYAEDDLTLCFPSSCQDCPGYLSDCSGYLDWLTQRKWPKESPYPFPNNFYYKSGDKELYGETSSAEECEAACHANKNCTTWTWHEDTAAQGSWRRKCGFRYDEKLYVAEQEGKISGSKLLTGDRSFHIYAYQWSSEWVGSSIDYDDMRYGDLVTHMSKCKGTSTLSGYLDGHMFMFDKWENESHDRFWAYESTKGWDVDDKCKSTEIVYEGSKPKTYIDCHNHHVLKERAIADKWAKESCEHKVWGHLTGGPRRISPYIICDDGHPVASPTPAPTPPSTPGTWERLEDTTLIYGCDIQDAKSGCYLAGTTDTPDQCQELCVADSECTGFTWHSEGQPGTPWDDPGEWDLRCVVRTDGKGEQRSESKHTSGIRPPDHLASLTASRESSVRTLRPVLDFHLPYHGP